MGGGFPGVADPGRGLPRAPTFFVRNPNIVEDFANRVKTTIAGYLAFSKGTAPAC
jgi:hypothetical protein